MELVVVTSGDKRTDLLRGPSLPGDDPLVALEDLCRKLALASVKSLEHLEGELVDDFHLRGQLVREIRSSKPDVVISFDPTPSLQHTDHRIVGRMAFDACWPCAGSARLHPVEGLPHSPIEMWLTGGSTPDLFVTLESDAGAALGILGVDWVNRREETFTQVDLRDAYGIRRHRGTVPPRQVHGG